MPSRLEVPSEARGQVTVLDVGRRTGKSDRRTVSDRGAVRRGADRHLGPVALGKARHVDIHGIAAPAAFLAVSVKMAMTSFITTSSPL